MVTDRRTRNELSNSQAVIAIIKTANMVDVVVSLRTIDFSPMDFRLDAKCIFGRQRCTSTGQGDQM